MSIEHSSNPNSQTNTFVELADSFLDELTEASSRQQSLTQFYEDLIRHLDTLLGFGQASLWLSNGDDWTMSIQSPGAMVENSTLSHETLTDVASVQRSRILEHQDSVRILSPIVGNTNFKKVLSCRFDTDLDPKVARVFRDFLDAVVEIADSFERQHLIANQSAKFKKIESFVQILHNSTKSLELSELAFQFANDCRSFAKSDRTWVFSTTNGLKLLACSGVSEINRRSKSVRQITRLAKVAVESKQNFSLDHGNQDMDPMFGVHFSSTQCKAIHIILIKDEAAITGVLVSENFDECDRLSTFEALNQVASAVQPSFNNAQYYSQLPLRRIAQMAHQLGKTTGMNSISKFWLTVGLIIVMFTSTFFVTCDFNIPVQGQVRPVQERYIFAPEDATVKELSVGYGDEVSVDQTLMTLYSQDLELNLKELQNELSAAKNRLRATKLLRAEAVQERKDSIYIDQLSAELEQTALKITSVNRKTDWLLDRMKALQVTSPIRGQVITRDVELRLLRRPVKSGDILLSVANTDSDWQIVFEIPDKEFGYLMDFAEQEQENQWHVDFRFLSDLNDTHEAVIGSFDKNNFFDTEGKSWIRGMAPIDHKEFSNLRVGQVVNGKINCGKRSLFFVWTRELRDYFRRNFFWK